MQSVSQSGSRGEMRRNRGEVCPPNGSPHLVSPIPRRVHSGKDPM